MVTLALLEPFYAFKKEEIGPYFVAILAQFMFKTNILEMTKLAPLTALKELFCALILRNSPLTRTKMDISIVKEPFQTSIKGKQWPQWVTDLAQIISNRLHFSGLNYRQRRLKDT